MRCLITLFLSLAGFAALSQPSAATVQFDVKKDLGANCLSVTVVSSGRTATEYVNGGLSSFYRVDVNAKLKTELPGVTKLLRGAAKYGYSGGHSFFYDSYAPGDVQYLGMPAPDTAAIRAVIMANADYGLLSEGSITEVLSITFLNEPKPFWHSLESVSIPTDMVCKRKTGLTLQTIRMPYWLRAYRKTPSDKWFSITWTTPDGRADSRQRAVLATETLTSYQMSKQTSLMEKANIKNAETAAASRLRVEVPKMNSLFDLMKWYHALLMEGDYAKIEAASLQLMHPDNFDNRTHLLNGIGQLMLSRIKNAVSDDFAPYNKQYCAVPIVNVQTKTSIAWWNKSKTQSSEIKLREDNGKVYVASFDIYTYNYSSEKKANEAMAATCR